MKVFTSRFGPLEIEPEDILCFPRGLVGFEECKHWMLLGDDETDGVAWMQCLSQPELAMAVVSPRRFLPGYQVRVGKAELLPLQLDESDEVFVLAVVAQNERALTVNLKAPILINLTRLLGRQVIVNDDQPLALEFAPAPSSGSAEELRRSA